MTAGSDLTTVIAPTGGAAVPKLLADVAAAGDALSEAGLMDIEKRMDLLAKAEKLTHALKTPREIMIQDTWSQVSASHLTLKPALTVNSLPMSLPSHLVYPRACGPPWQAMGTPRNGCLI